MKIIQLTAENVKKLKVVDITPIEGLNQITGKNGSGKTSVLDSIWWALGGKEGIQSVPIRKGAEKASIRLNLGDIVVERKFLASGTTTITVKNADGAAYPSPQAMLDALLGELSFDPLAFSRMPPKDQLLELRRISKLSTDIDSLDLANKADYAKRTDLNRSLKAKLAQADGILIADGLPDAPVDESALIDQMQRAGEHNSAIEQRKARRDQARRDASDKQAESERLRMQAKDAADRVARLTADADAAMEAARAIDKQLDDAEPLPEPIDITVIRASLNSAKVLNASIAERERRAAIKAEATALEIQAKALTDQMTERDLAKSNAISAATMPVDGLGFGDGSVTFNGLPFDQASGAEQLRISCSIAMAANAKLRVVRIKDGSLLDDEGIRLIAQLAAEKDYQVWLERVDNTGKIGIVMEDGIVSVDHQREEANANLPQD